MFLKLSPFSNAFRVLTIAFSASPTKTKSISGFDFAKMLEEHLRAQDGIEILDGDKVNKVEKVEKGAGHPNYDQIMIILKYLN